MKFNRVERAQGLVHVVTALNNAVEGGDVATQRSLIRSASSLLADLIITLGTDPKVIKPRATKRRKAMR